MLTGQIFGALDAAAAHVREYSPTGFHAFDASKAQALCDEDTQDDGTSMQPAHQPADYRFCAATILDGEHMHTPSTRAYVTALRMEPTHVGALAGTVCCVCLRMCGIVKCAMFVCFI